MSARGPASMMALVVVFFVFLGGCAAILVVSALVTARWREAIEAEKARLRAARGATTDELEARQRSGRSRSRSRSSCPGRPRALRCRRDGLRHPPQRTLEDPRLGRAVRRLRPAGRDLEREDISLAPPGLTSRSLQMATASAQVVVDTPLSTLIDARQDTHGLDALTNRALLLGNVMASPQVRADIAQRAGMPFDELQVVPPITPSSRACSPRPATSGTPATSSSSTVSTASTSRRTRRSRSSRSTPRPRRQERGGAGERRRGRHAVPTSPSSRHSTGTPLATADPAEAAGQGARAR